MRSSASLRDRGTPPIAVGLGLVAYFGGIVIDRRRTRADLDQTVPASSSLLRGSSGAVAALAHF